jgi:hypothetical protein
MIGHNDLSGTGAKKQMTAKISEKLIT